MKVIVMIRDVATLRSVPTPVVKSFAAMFGFVVRET